MPKYLRHEETMIYFHNFATKTRPIYLSHFPEKICINILNNLENIAKKSIGDVISVVTCTVKTENIWITSKHLKVRTKHDLCNSTK